MDVLKKQIVQILRERAARLPRNSDYRQALLEVASCIAHNNHNPYMTLRDYRERAGYSGDDICNYLHVKKFEYIKAEREASMPKDWLVVLADVYNVPYEHLYYAQARSKNQRTYQQPAKAG